MIWLYRFFVYPIFLFAYGLSCLFSSKSRQGFSLRCRRPDLSGARGGIWFHCASGEFEYAKPVISELSRHYAVGLSYFSPSVSRSAHSFAPLKAVCASPWDTPWAVARFLDNAKPRLLMIARTDLWPELLYQCRKRGIPTVLFAATLTSGSGRMQARWFYRWVMSLVDWVACVSEADQAEFRKLSPQLQTSVLGDTRFDQVRTRLAHPKALKDDLKPQGPTLVAGSTWSEDEAVLIPAFAQLVQKQPALRLILAPHEPTTRHLDELSAMLEKQALTYQNYSSADGPWQVLVIDQVGILAELYTWGTMAFVGGSFRKTVHSVMEPLAAGLPTAVGPYHHNNREAQLFAAQNLPGTDLTMVQEVAGTADLIRWADHLLNNRHLQKGSLLAFVEAQSQATARLMVELTDKGWLKASDSIPLS